MKAEIIKVDEGLLMIVDGNEDTAWAITEEEVFPILMACQKYLEAGNKLVTNSSLQPILTDSDIFDTWKSVNKNGKEI